MTQSKVSYRFPKSVRIIRSDDFGVLLRSRDVGSLRIGRDSVSVCAQVHRRSNRVRFGFTVGKSNVHNSTDRALIKRIMREVARHNLPQFSEQCLSLGVGLDVSLRFRTPLRVGLNKTTRTQAKLLTRKSTMLCMQAIQKRLPKLAQEFSCADQP